jgi:SpoIID/LytB domain protein
MVASLAVLAGSIVQPVNAATTPNSVPKSFAISGSGWGHGLGMSQYGAYGMALDGKKAPEIISHYYQGAKASEELTTSKLRVGLLQDKDFVAIRGEKHPEKRSGGSLVLWIDGVKYEPAIPSGVNLVLGSITTKGQSLTAARLNGKVIGQGATILIKWNNTSSLVNLASGATATDAVTNLGTVACAFNSCKNRYRYGYLEVKSGALANDSRVDLNVVNVLRLSDQYLYGLGEMPSSWHIEALKTQVIAARSFALIKSRSIRSYCECNLDTTDGSQVFSGFSKEFASSGDKWKRAVDETVGTTGSTSAEKARSGLVVKAGTKVLDAYYSSSTGGKTQPRSEVWGAGTISWLVSVPDPWSLDPRTKNPNAKWVKTISQKELVDSLKAANIPVTDVASFQLGTKYKSGAVSSLVLRDSAGNVTKLEIGPGKTVSPDRLRGLLGIKSTYISSIKPGASSVPGSINSTLLPLKKISNVSWPDSNVLPKQFDLKGKVAPAQVGATVKLQCKVDGKWTTVATAKTNNIGGWAIRWNEPPVGKHNLRIAASNSKGTITTEIRSVTMVGTVGITAPKSAKRNSSFTVFGTVTPAYANLTVAFQRKVDNGPWETVARLKTGTDGKWSSTRYTGSKNSTVWYRIKTEDSRVGKLTSKVVKTTIK